MLGINVKGLFENIGKGFLGHSVNNGLQNSLEFFVPSAFEIMFWGGVATPSILLKIYSKDVLGAK
jgi:hypothetical protein